jgi:predicted aconitase
MRLSAEERAIAGGERGEALAMPMRIVAEAGRLLGARTLTAISSAHIDGCLYHGDGGVEFAERLIAAGAQTAVPTTLNVGALDLVHAGRVHWDDHRHAMAGRLMTAYQAMGCAPTWTCAPYQTGHRPDRGAQVAWGESNAVCFVNSVLGARTNRYGDFLDICCAVTGRAPLAGLHLDDNRRATVVVDTAALSPALKDTDAFYPVLGAWLGAEVGNAVAVIDGLPGNLGEDRLKGLGAAAASSGAVALFHVAGVTPEAPTVEAALGGRAPEMTLYPTTVELSAVRDRLSTAVEPSGRIDAVAVGSPHFSLDEFAALEALTAGKRFQVPFYACTSRANLAALEIEGRVVPLEAAGIEFVVDTCIVVAPILADGGGVLMTNSGKFAYYTPANTGYGVVYGSLADCVASAVSGRVERDETLWR